MATEIFANNIKTTLVSAIAADDTSIVVYYADFPAIGGETTNYSRAVITSGTVPGSAYEYLVVDQTFYESGMVTLEVQRGQEGSVGFDWPAGSILYLAATAASFTDLQSGGSSLIGVTSADETMLGAFTPWNVTLGDESGDNTFVGTYTGNALTEGSYAGNNVVVGNNAYRYSTGSYNNTAIGHYALSMCNSNYNIAVGSGAMRYSETGDSEIAIGRDTLSSTAGYGNIAIGTNAIQSNSTGYNNIGIGDSCIMANTTGVSNVAIGQYSLSSNNTGSYNVALGQGALSNETTGNSNICIGGTISDGSYLPAYNITTESNYASFGSTSLTNAYIQVAWTVNSDLRNKIVHSAVPHGLDFVNSLLPIKYQFKEDRESEVAVGPIRYGFGAQDILALEGENPVIIDNSEEENLRFNESSLIPVLVKAIQELTAEVQALKAKVG